MNDLLVVSLLCSMRLMPFAYILLGLAPTMANQVTKGKLREGGREGLTVGVPSLVFFVCCVCDWFFCAVCSRKRSEGFPFIVGVWGWTCVRFVLLPCRRVVVYSSSCRRRVVVANSSPTR